MSYLGRDEFGRVLILKFGIPIEIPESLANIFKGNKKQVVDLVLKIVETRMRSVILTTQTYEEYILVKMLRDL